MDMETDTEEYITHDSDEEDDYYCWPWTGIVVNIVKDPDSEDDFESTAYWMKRFSEFKPDGVKLLFGDDKNKCVVVLVRFGRQGYGEARMFEKSFKDTHHSKEEWSASGNAKDSSVYAWLANADDFKSQGLIGDYLREHRELKTFIGKFREAAVRDKEELMMSLDLAQKVLKWQMENEAGKSNESFEDFVIRYNQEYMHMNKMLEEKQSLHQAYDEEARKMPLPKIELDEQELSRAVAEQQRKLQETMDISGALTRQLDAKRKREVEIEGLKEMKLCSDEDGKRKREMETEQKL